MDKDRLFQIGKSLGKIIGAAMVGLFIYFGIIAIGFTAHGIWYLLWHGWNLFVR
jgi:hypothetical protein